MLVTHADCQLPPASVASQDSPKDLDIPFDEEKKSRENKTIVSTKVMIYTVHKSGFLHGFNSHKCEHNFFANLKFL